MSSPASSNASSISSPSLPLVIHITPGGHEEFPSKREALNDVRRHFRKFKGHDACIGRIRKVTLHPNKVSLYLWVDDPSPEEPWMSFATDFAAHKGHVVRLGDRQVKMMVAYDQKMKKECEEMSAHFSASNLSAVANLSAILKDSPHSRKRQFHASVLTKGLGAASELVMEKLKTKQAKTLSKVHAEAQSAELEVEHGSDVDAEGEGSDN